VTWRNHCSPAARSGTPSARPIEALKQAAAQYQQTVITAYQNVADTLHAILSDADALAADLEAERAAKVTLDLTHARCRTAIATIWPIWRPR
jgi:outer membrane protein TolC